MKSTKLFITLLLLVFASAMQANAQETISAEKKALIKEFLEVTDAKNNAQKILDAMLLQMEKQMPAILMQTALQDPHAKPMSGKEKDALEKYINEASARIGQRFRELAPQRLNYAQTVEQISYSLYDKFFTDRELKDLIAFYSSETGKKSIRVMPELMAESMQRYSEIAMPKIQQLITEISEEEMKRLYK